MPDEINGLDASAATGIAPAADPALEPSPDGGGSPPTPAPKPAPVPTTPTAVSATVDTPAPMHAAKSPVSGNSDLSATIEQAARENGIPSGILHAQAAKESHTQTGQTSPKGAEGVMQIMPKTAASLGVDPTDPHANIHGAAKYLKQLHDRFGSWDKALAAYNWGPTNLHAAVLKHGDGWLAATPRETQNYVHEILTHPVIGPVKTSAITKDTPTIGPAPHTLSERVDDFFNMPSAQYDKKYAADDDATSRKIDSVLDHLIPFHKEMNTLQKSIEGTKAGKQAAQLVQDQLAHPESLAMGGVEGPEGEITGAIEGLSKNAAPESPTSGILSKVPGAIQVKPPAEPAADYSNFHRLAEAQRGEPESAMLDIQHHPLGPGVYSNVVEHVGDLTHRMAEPFAAGPDRGFGYESVKPKVERALQSLNSGYGFEREMEGNINNNFRYHEEKGDLAGKSFTDLRADLQKLGQKYAAAHDALPTFNPVQKTAQEAAAALGKMDFDTARTKLQDLKVILDQGPEAWKAAASQPIKPPVAAAQSMLHAVPGAILVKPAPLPPKTQDASSQGAGNAANGQSGDPNMMTPPAIHQTQEQQPEWQNENVARHMASAWKEAGAGKTGDESSFLITKDHPNVPIPLPMTHNYHKETFSLVPGTTAIYHTHPDNSDPEPSAADRKIADDHHVKMYVMSSKGLSLYDPETRKVTQVAEGLNYLPANSETPEQAQAQKQVAAATDALDPNSAKKKAADAAMKSAWAATKQP